MAGQFQVDPAALVSASQDFEREYEVLVQAISAFQSHALDINGAFGWLGPSGSLLSQYESTTESAFRGLDQMAKLLIGASQGLARTASNYAAADALSTMQGG